MTQEPEDLSGGGPLGALPDDVVVRVLSALADAFRWPRCNRTKAHKDNAPREFVWFRRSIPLVSRRFCHLCRQNPQLWDTVHISVEHEVRLGAPPPPKRPPESPSAAPTSATRPPSSSAAAAAAISAAAALFGTSPSKGPSSFLAGSSPPLTAGWSLSALSSASTSPMPPSSPTAHHRVRLLPSRPAARLRANAVIAWCAAHGRSPAHLLLDVSSPSHDLDSPANLRALLAAVHRSLTLLQLEGLPAADALMLEAVGWLKGLQGLTIGASSRGAIEAVLPYLAYLPNLVDLRLDADRRSPLCLSHGLASELPRQLRSLAVSHAEAVASGSLFAAVMPSFAAQCGQLTQLELRHCDLGLPQSGRLLHGLHQLRSLNLEACRNLPPSFWEDAGELPRLTELAIRGSAGGCCVPHAAGGVSLPRLPQQIGALVSLRRLCLSHNSDLGAVAAAAGAEQQPQGLGGAGALAAAHGNGGGGSHLTGLMFAAAAAFGTAAAAGAPAALSATTVPLPPPPLPQDLMAGPLPRSLLALTALEELDLSFCGLRALPPLVLQLPALTSLQLQGNYLTSFPSPPATSAGGSSGSARLLHLDLAGNPLTSAHALYGLAQHTSLVDVSLPGCCASPPGAAAAASSSGGASAAGAGAAPPAASSLGLPSSASWPSASAPPPSSAAAVRQQSAGAASGGGPAQAAATPVLALPDLVSQLQRLRRLSLTSNQFDAAAVRVLLQVNRQAMLQGRPLLLDVSAAAEPSQPGAASSSASGGSGRSTSAAPGGALQLL